MTNAEVALLKRVRDEAHSRMSRARSEVNDAADQLLADGSGLQEFIDKRRAGIAAARMFVAVDTAYKQALRETRRDTPPSAAA